MQELLEDIRALRQGIEALNKRSLEQGRPLSRAELNEVLAQVAKGTSFTIDYQGVAAQLQPHLATPESIGAAVAAGRAQLQEVISQLPRSIPLEKQVWGFTSFSTLLGVWLLLLSCFGLSAYAWKQKGAAEAQVELLKQQQAKHQATYDWLSKGYLDLKRENPKAAQKYFPH